MELRQQTAETRPVTINWREIAGLVGLSLKIFCLRLLTLGIYHFWGKTEVRRKIWSAVHLQSQPLEYTGTGKELLLGFLIVFALVILPINGLIFGAVLYFGNNHPGTYVAQFVIVAAIFYLVGVAQYRARRYRLSRTNWRGIRGGMAGSPWRYGWTSFWTALLIPLTLGWIVPWRAVRLQRILTDNTRFGETPMRFEGDARALYLPFLVYWLGSIIIYGLVLAGLQFFALITMFSGGTPGRPMFLSLPSSLMTVLPAQYLTIALIGLIIIGVVIALSVVSAWYTTRLYNHFAASTHIDNARFQLSATPISLIWLAIGNFLLSLLTLGIATPIVQARLAGYFVTRLAIEGSIDFDRIAQSEAALSRTGEGLAEAFDIDAF